MWGLDGNEPPGVPEGHHDVVEAVAFAADGTRLLTAAWDDTTRLWSVETGELLDTKDWHYDGWLDNVALSPDGRWLASNPDERAARVGDFGSDRHVFTWSIAMGESRGLSCDLDDWVGHPDEVIFLTFS